MKTILLLLFAATANAQWADFSTLTASSNLANAMNGKSNIQITTSGQCSTKAGTAGKDFCWDTVALFQCTVTGTPGTWSKAITAASIVAGDVPTLNQSTTGNAATATALASTPSLCSTGQAPTGILANGNATGCAVIGGGGGATTNQNLRDVVMTFDGGGLPVAGSATRCREVTFAGTIQGAYIEADVSGSITIDVKTVAHSSYTGPASASTITASATPALSSAVKYTDTTLTGWTTSLAANTAVCFAMSAPATVTWATITLKVAAN